MNRKTLLICATFFLLSTATAAYSETIPPNIAELNRDYYNVYGEPQLSASVMGDTEFESGETTTLFIQLTNEGEIHTFENEKFPTGANETRDSWEESHLELDVTTAISIQGTLENDNGAPVTILSGMQEAGYLRTGEASLPMQFDIEIFKNAESGMHELALNLTYQYQKEVKVEGYPNQEYNYWYVTKNQTVPVHIRIKPDAYFEIQSNSSKLVPNRKNLIFITYTNVGSAVARDAVGTIDVDDPFTSTTDDKAFLGTLFPGDSYQAQYLIEVDDDTLPKTYKIDTKVEYTNEHGDILESDVMKVSAIVNEPVSFLETVASSSYFMKDVVQFVVPIVMILVVISGLLIFGLPGLNSYRRSR